jgi:uncharacterized protein
MTESTFVEVTGLGAASAPPDEMRAHLVAEVVASTVAQAFTDAGAALQAMLATLREHGAADEDLRSTGIELYSDRERHGLRGRFQAAMSVEAVLRDLESAGAALSAAVEAGGDASRVRGIHLTSTATDRAVVEARDGAWADARAKAEQYAGLAGRTLGTVLSVSELGGRAGTRGMGGDAVAFAAAGGAPIEAGEQTVRAVITVRWELT